LVFDYLFIINFNTSFSYYFQIVVLFIDLNI
jgi:hypothetical protein